MADGIIPTTSGMGGVYAQQGLLDNIGTGTGMYGSGGGVASTASSVGTEALGTENSLYNPAAAKASAKAGGIVQAVGGIVDVVQGIQANRQAKQDIITSNQELERLKASQPSLSTPSEYYMAVKNAYDQRLVQMRTQDINRSLATTAAAAQQYGSRGLGSIMQATEQAQRQMQEQALTQQQLQTQALTNLADARQQEVVRREARSTRDIDYGYDAVARAEAAKAAAVQQIGAGITNAVGGAAKTAIGFGLFEEGGEVQKTPGEFNHDTNEMYVVDEDGKDMNIALTGGEYVIAPKDARRLKREASKGKSPLHKFVRSLVNRFEKADDNG